MINFTEAIETAKQEIDDFKKGKPIMDEVVTVTLKGDDAIWFRYSLDTCPEQLKAEFVLALIRTGMSKILDMQKKVFGLVKEVKSEEG